MTARTLMLVGFLGLGIPGLSVLLWVSTKSSTLIEGPVGADPPTPDLPLGVPPPNRARGEHLVRHVLDCGGCHGADFTGHKVMDNWLLGRFFAPNLTSGQGGIGPQLDTAGWDLAIRHGVGRDGAPLLYMPSGRYSALADADLMSVVKYLKDLPGDHREMLDSDPGPVFRLLVAAGTIGLDAHRIDHDTRPPASVPQGATPSYGGYLAQIAGCLDCHGDDRLGRPGPPGAPSAPPIDPATLRTWTRAQLSDALRRGISPDGRRLDRYMPWDTYAGMTPLEIDALSEFLRVGG